MTQNVLVIAFDGMDKELIDQFDLDHVTQDEYGQIDNHTDITRIKTGELFASFITGKTWKEHGIRGLKGWDSEFMNAVEGAVPNREPFYSWAARVKDVFTRATGVERRTFTREDLACPTMFDTVPDAVAVNVPSYNENAGIEVFSKVLDQYGIEYAEREAEKEHRERTIEFWDAMEGEAHTLLMAHFHYLDSINHLFGDVMEDEERLEAAYRKIDEFAGEIIEEASGRYDTIIFMSDHGLPEGPGHNENAFYSSNVELFPDKEPHITDFHDAIVDRVGAQDLHGVEV
ncbi:MAG: alkaline phosphatase family protein [Candidatus Nanohaloarchaea archaeon]|nr:alkaline phosphatase family protein [Candidatus Nanohaloarchaea archaeon]